MKDASQIDNDSPGLLWKPRKTKKWRIPHFLAWWKAVTHPSIQNNQNLALENSPSNQEYQYHHWLWFLIHPPRPWAFVYNWLLFNRWIHTNTDHFGIIRNKDSCREPGLNNKLATYGTFISGMPIWHH